MRETVEASVNYVVPAGEPHYNYYLVDPPAGKTASNEVAEPHVVSITSVRNLAKKPSVHREGFELATFETKIKDIYDHGQRDAIYDPEIAAFMKRQTGAREVFVYQPFLRGIEAQRRMPGSITAPAPMVHVDNTERTGPYWFEQVLGANADKFRGRRFAIINVWRPITGPLRDYPLALCDASSVPEDDLIPAEAYSAMNADGIHGDDGEVHNSQTYSVKYNPAHRWFYCPEMQTNEVLLIKCYDSQREGVARYTPHCSFKDPTAPSNVLPRASIEVRTITIW